MIAQYKPIFDRESLAKEVSDYILGDGYFTEFKKTEEFEQKLAKVLNVKYCSVVSNGTISLSLALLAHGIGPGDIVFIPNLTMIATMNAVRLIGAEPILVDICEENLCLDIDKVKEYIENEEFDEKLAVIYVTLNGRCHDRTKYDEFQNFCWANNVALIEDNAQSLGSNWNYFDGWQDDITKINCPKNGIGSFSFSMPKIITTGQGGCLVTDDEKLYQKIEKLKDFGRVRAGEDFHDEFGINCKFTEIESVIGLNQLRDLDYRIERKRHIYSKYITDLQYNPGVVTYGCPCYYTPWFVDIYVIDREGLYIHLLENGIKTRKIYPPLNSQKINSTWNKHPFPISEKICNMGLWLPSSLDIKDEEIKYICNKIKEFYDNAK